ncbi:MAG: monovalent cation/H(+) antiporter subunit G [Gammaproteobacteria bacterium]|nr:monovalent cation/H(+) antiporter subunit G [Gammaproteobacteria bacterium]
MMTFLGNLLLLVGGLFCLLGALGLVRMPDVYNRIQAGTKAVTMGSLCILAGVGLLYPTWWPKLVAVALFILLTNPVGSSAIARALYRSGIRPWHKAGEEES